ncbi:MAG: AAA family ATPase [Eubacteriales bacterium]
MKLQELELENYRGFKKLKVSFHPELSVIIGGKKSKEIRQLNSRTLGYLDCLEAESNEKLMLNWFQNMTLKELQGKSTIPELEAVRKSIIKCYKLITGYIDVKVEFNIDTHGIDLVYKETVDESYRRSPMKELSDGYKNTLSMIADIAYRMAVLNPALLENVIEQTPGVILIDEIDLHLHPKWQQRILGDLKEIFPLVQFIVTTHAPAVIHSVDKKSLLIFNDEGDLQGAEEILGSLVKIVGNQDSEVVGARKASTYYKN